MKLRSKIWTGIGIVLIVSLTLFMMGNQNSKPEEEKTISNAQAESKQERSDGELETAESVHEGDPVSEGNDHEQTQADANQEQMKVEENQKPLQQGVNPLDCIFPQDKKRSHSDSVDLLQKRLRSIIVLLRVD